MRTHHHLLFLIMTCWSINSLAQSQIKGTVISSLNKTPVPGANILLLKSTDSTLVKGIVAAQNGSFVFEKVAEGSYIINVTNTGFESAYLSEVNISGSNSSIELPTILLKESAQNLQGVTVSTRKPLFEQKIDRLVVNVKNSITAAGSTALDVLERSPGVIVNRQSSSISLSGKQGVMVMINGKITYMPMNALVDMLSGMSAGNIERIELITTPPANLDAEGNAGYINIVLINNPELGLNGSFTVSAGYGKGIYPSASTNFNYRTGKVNLFGDFSITVDQRKPKFFNYRRIHNQSDVLETHTTSDRDPSTLTPNVRLGLDYQINKKIVLGFLLAGNMRKYEMEENVTNTISKNGIPDTILKSENKELNNWRHLMGNINFLYSPSSSETFSFDMDFLTYTNKQPFDYHLRYYNGSGQFLSAEELRSRKRTPIYFWVAKFDYTRKLSNKVNLEAGAKTTISTFENDVTLDRYTNNTWTRDPDYSSLAKLKEDISALYTSFAINPSEKTNLKFGLRYEYTNSNLGTATQKDIVDRHYGKLFPSIFILRKLSDEQNLSFSYSRRINRPTFNNLAPFVYFLDPQTYISGNSALQPSITDNLKLDLSYKKNLLSLTYNYENNSIAIFQSKFDLNSNKQTLQAENLNYIQTFSVLLAVPLNVSKWWSMQYNVLGSHQTASTSYDNKPLKLKQANINLYSMQSFTLPKEYSVELSGFYQSPSLFGRYITRGFGKLDVGIQKKFKNNNTKLRFAVLDVFSTMKFVSETKYQESLYAKLHLQFIPRTFMITFSRNFGRNEVKASRSRKTGSEDERTRVDIR